MSTEPNRTTLPEQDKQPKPVAPGAVPPADKAEKQPENKPANQPGTAK